MERPNRDEASHVGGIDSNVSVKGFIGKKYSALVLIQAQERKNELRTSLMDMDFRTMCAVVHDYYSRPFHGEMVKLQVVTAEFAYYWKYPV